MKNNIIKSISVLSIASMALFTSCSSDDDAVQQTSSITIELTEVGLNNSGEGQVGDELHLEAEIFAEAKIATIEVELHSETDSSIPEIYAVYDDYDGLLNATFHKHIDIPPTQPAGHYHLHLTVKDQDGNTEMVESEVEIIAAGEESGIVIGISELGHGTEGNYHTHVGEEMHIEGTITSVYPIATITVEIHNESDPSAPEIEATFPNYAGQTTADFHEHINIPTGQPAGEYHFHLNVTDNQGHSETVEYELEIE